MGQLKLRIGDELLITQEFLHGRDWDGRATVKIAKFVCNGDFVYAEDDLGQTLISLSLAQRMRVAFLENQHTATALAEAQAENARLREVMNRILRDDELNADRYKSLIIAALEIKETVK
jgi:hypothetical protein